MTHAIVAALAIDDFDAALQSGLLDGDGCPNCTLACRHWLLAESDARRFALAARERFRKREARMARKQQERLARRAPPQGATPVLAPLPPAAAAALARAKERAAGRNKT